MKMYQVKIAEPCGDLIRDTHYHDDAAETFFVNDQQYEAIKNIVNSIEIRKETFAKILPELVTSYITKTRVYGVYPFPNFKIHCVKELRARMPIGLKDAVDIFDSNADATAFNTEINKLHLLMGNIMNR